MLSSARAGGKRPILVDGHELEDGFGISFEQDEFTETDILTGIINILPGPTLRAWITKQNWNGEYHKYREVTGCTVYVWDEQGRAWEYEHGTLQITEDNIDFEKEYGDE